jgi:Rod binding domain-containing protein
MDVPTEILPAAASVRDSDASQTVNRRNAEDLAEQFEAVFVSMLIKELRQSTSEDGGLFAGDRSDTFGGMFDSFMGEHIAAGGGIGLSRLLAESGHMTGVNVSGMADIRETMRQQALEAYHNGINISAP